MNESTPLPPPVPTFTHAPKPEDDPSDREAIRHATDLVEAVLRQPRRVMHQLGSGGAPGLLLPMLGVIVAFVAVYGLIVGSFSGSMQWWAAPVKIAGGTIATAIICLPSLYIFSCLSGSPARLGAVAGALGGALVLATLLLIGFAPVAWLFSQSTTSVPVIGFLHIAFWIVSSGFGIRFLYTMFHHFGLQSKAGLNVWIIIFLLVSLQMTAALRPLVGPGEGTPLLPEEKMFFAAHWLESVNAPERR